MEKLNSTARKLDIVAKIFSVMLTIAIVCCLVGLGIIAVGLIFKLDPHLIGTNYNVLDLGLLELEVADSHAPSERLVLMLTATEIILTLLCLYRGLFAVKYIRNILQPMIENAPFHNTISTNLVKLARCTCSIGIGINLLELLNQVFSAKAFQLPELLLSDKITHITMNYHFDLGFLIVAAVLLLLSYVFRYGEQLQQLSDETL